MEMSAHSRSACGRLSRTARNGLESESWAASARPIFSGGGEWEKALERKTAENAPCRTMRPCQPTWPIVFSSSSAVFVRFAESRGNLARRVPAAASPGRGVEFGLPLLPMTTPVRRHPVPHPAGRPRRAPRRRRGRPRRRPPGRRCPRCSAASRPTPPIPAARPRSPPPSAARPRRSSRAGSTSTTSTRSDGSKIVRHVFGDNSAARSSTSSRTTAAPRRPRT